MSIELKSLNGKLLIKDNKLCTNCCLKCPDNTACLNLPTYTFKLQGFTGIICIVMNLSCNIGSPSWVETGCHYIQGFQNVVGTTFCDGDVILNCINGIWDMDIFMCLWDNIRNGGGSAHFSGILKNQNGIYPNGEYEGSWDFYITPPCSNTTFVNPIIF